MERPRRQPKAHWLQVAVSAVLLIAFIAVYAAVLRLTIDVTRLSDANTANHRDTVYLIVHASVLSAAVIVGFATGKWLSGLGVAYALLFLSVVAVAMVAVQVGSQTLACEADRNDIVRHWQC